MAKRRTLMSELEPVSDEKWVAALEAKDRYAAGRLKHLVEEENCDRSFLVACLRVIASSNLKGIKKTDADRATQEFQAAARWVRELETSDVGFKIRDAVPGGLADLEAGLEALIRAVNENIPLADCRGPRTRTDARLALVRHVRRKAHRPCDPEVAALVGCTPGAQLKWRDYHREDLKRETVFEREWQAKAKADRWQTLWERASTGPTRHFQLYLSKDPENV